MKKFMKVVITLLAIAAIAVPAMAEDRLSLNGEMRVFSWTKDDGTNTDTFADQRLRIGGKFAIADGVSVTFRTDLSEGNWGTDASLGRQAQHTDRAHFDIDLDSFALRGGQQYVAFGDNFNSQDTGIRFDLKGDIPVTAFYMVTDGNDIAKVTKGEVVYNTTTKEYEAAAATTAAESHADAYLYGVGVSHKSDDYAATLFVGGQVNGDENVNMFGVTLDYNLDEIKLSAELDMFTGEESDGVDATGLQLAVGADMGMFGANVFYAASNDDLEKKTYTHLGNDFGIGDFLGLGLGFDAEDFSGKRIFDLFGEAGLMAVSANASTDVSDDLKVSAVVAYAQASDGDLNDDDNLMAVAAGAKYALAEAASLDAELQYKKRDSLDDPTIVAAVGIFVGF